MMSSYPDDASMAAPYYPPYLNKTLPLPTRSYYNNNSDRSSSGGGEGSHHYCGNTVPYMSTIPPPFPSVSLPPFSSLVAPLDDEYRHPPSSLPMHGQQIGDFSSSRAAQPSSVQQWISGFSLSKGKDRM
jgi:hypothetical protein